MTPSPKSRTTRKAKFKVGQVVAINKWIERGGEMFPLFVRVILVDWRDDKYPEATANYYLVTLPTFGPATIWHHENCLRPLTKKEAGR
jgi:hypothetical protein